MKVSRKYISGPRALGPTRAESFPILVWPTHSGLIC